MDRKMLLLFNHSLCPNQREKAFDEFDLGGIIDLPGSLKGLWGQVPPDAESLDQFVQPFKKWLSENSEENDVVLIQGDFGATYLMVAFALENKLIPVYATTRREAIETSLADGTVKMEHLFRFCRFRKYGA